jgi:hypothetical protein
MTKAWTTEDSLDAPNDNILETWSTEDAVEHRLRVTDDGDLIVEADLGGQWNNDDQYGRVDQCLPNFNEVEVRTNAEL